ncbi:hypothetical protein [Nocardia sp. NPDC004750]
MFGELQLLDSAGGTIGRRHPAADTFEPMARLLDGATRVRRITVTDRPDLYLFEVERNHGTPALVVWERRGIADQGECFGLGLVDAAVHRRRCRGTAVTPGASGNIFPITGESGR